MSEKPDLRQRCSDIYREIKEKKLTVVKQGAEAITIKTEFYPGEVCLLKCRPAKRWRHPILDQKLSRKRCLVEARLLAKCHYVGIKCPMLYFIDANRGQIYMEWIDGPCVRDYIREICECEIEKKLIPLMKRIGSEVAKMHKNDIVHGDLTTSNMMLESHNNPVPIFIDFGLGSVSESEEDKAVDIYVLERALSSTLPESESLFHHVLDSYAQSWKQSKATLRRFEEVRMRGRKRTMIG
ncbi:EKC/KEOPS complex associated ATPase Bud32 [Schizosaccharomyces pombe]|uniref:EKC/KEOPS complex subunit SPAP27G11.07c n=1 Tax=Schizosaccharomyces pombe (strain 972 / ATCC 24843) TaxID=284812 RepID=BUD32_SCHPO|nr:putative serine/threonine protein kinase [Schizosaccharomyces pombe]Q9P7N1.1 RecName: Full=EKC/KEOPS complex subunit SPAP27G11.07c; AltName: Full=Atypical serine/threonine protein kinase BUD32 homolog [Schizosaccharomyces pombe 972h-]CAB76028.1 serine/threonine protein kinase (predicted) [Schizosaccharomyces pombe]|eukprot:NP_593411.1 putative serine/threonine protein kinase [Schizosaccharomyces pombe]